MQYIKDTLISKVNENVIMVMVMPVMITFIVYEFVSGVLRKY